MAGDDALVAALGESQRLGFLGARPIDEVVAHARVFVGVIREVTRPGLAIVDIGSGGGVPGLVIATDLPEAELTLVDRRAKRTDFLERVVRRCGWSDRVHVVCDDVQRLAGRQPSHFDVVVARGFGPPDLTLRLAARLVRPGGRIVVSEPPHGDRWDRGVIARLELSHEEIVHAAGRVACFTRVSRGTGAAGFT